LPDIPLADEESMSPWWRLCVPLVSVVEVLSPCGVVAVSCVVLAGVFFMSSVRVELDELGVVEVCAIMDTEKHRAAAVIISFFMVFRLLVGIDRFVPTSYQDAAAHRKVCLCSHASC
jgi:hypothetical protein